MNLLILSKAKGAAMIKRKLIFAVTVVILLLSASGINAYAEFKAKNWGYYREIDKDQLQTGKNYRIMLDSQVYDASQISLADLRIVMDGRLELPYEIAIITGNSETKNMVSTIVENNRTGDNSNILILDLGTEVRPNNKITLDITERNFGKKVSVEGSNDKLNWVLLVRDAYIYDFSFGGEQAQRTGQAKWSRAVNSKYMVDFSYNASSRDTAVSYPESRFRYIKVTLFGTKDEEPVTITRANIRSHYVVPAEEAEYNCIIKENKVDQQAKTSYTILDFGAKNLPIQSIKINCDGSNYYRTVYVQGSNDLKEWVELGSGDIFDYDVENFRDARREIFFTEGRCRYIKLTILNQDNVPINVIAATGHGLKRSLVFPFQKAEPIRLYYDNQLAQAPVYDYSRFIRKADFTKLAVVALGQQVRNPFYNPDKIKRPWTEEHPYILWIAIIGIVVILLFLVASMMKKVK